MVGFPDHDPQDAAAKQKAPNDAGASSIDDLEDGRFTT
jgi:hypothetical protein